MLKENEEFDPCLTGNGLGELTDEIQKDYGIGSKIIKFVCLGPKNYGYQIRTANHNIITQIKVKGITLCQAATETNGVNFANMNEMAKKFQSQKTIKKYIKQQQIVANARHEMFTRQFVKEFKVVSKKRRLVNVNETVPYGWKKFNNDLSIPCFEKEVYNLTQKYGYIHHKLSISEETCRFLFEIKVVYIITEIVLNFRRRSFYFDEDEILWILLQIFEKNYNETMYRANKNITIKDTDPNTVTVELVTHFLSNKNSTAFTLEKHYLDEILQIDYIK